MLNRFLVACAIVACFIPVSSRAHHGLDFILVQTVHLPGKGTMYGVGRVDYISEEDYEMEFEPALLYGATDWMTLELHAHYEKESGESTRYESIAPALSFRLTPRGQSFSAGAIAEYEFADNSDDDDVVEMTAVFGYESSGWITTANVLYEKHSGSSAEWGYAAGVRHTLGEVHGMGLELLGSFEGDGSSEALLGYYGEYSQQLSLNAGIGVGIDQGPDWAFRTALIWRFK